MLALPEGTKSSDCRLYTLCWRDEVMVFTSITYRWCTVIPSTHRRRDSTVEFSRVGGVYWIRN